MCRAVLCPGSPGDASGRGGEPLCLQLLSGRGGGGGRMTKCTFQMLCQPIARCLHPLPGQLRRRTQETESPHGTRAAGGREEAAVRPARGGGMHRGPREHAAFRVYFWRQRSALPREDLRAAAGSAARGPDPGRRPRGPSRQAGDEFQPHLGPSSPHKSPLSLQRRSDR